MVLEKTQDKQKKPGIFTAAELWKKQFDPIKWTIPGILPEGATILAGSPKVGKSWLAFSIALSVASGGKALGTIDVEQGDALYLALEDNDRRLKRRLERLWFDDQKNPPERLHFADKWPRLDEGGTGHIESWLSDHPEARLVIIDTLHKIRPHNAKLDRNLYTSDYVVGDILTPLSQKHGVAIVVVHHTRPTSRDVPIDTMGLPYKLCRQWGNGHFWKDADIWRCSTCYAMPMFFYGETCTVLKETKP